MSKFDERFSLMSQSLALYNLCGDKNMDEAKVANTSVISAVWLNPNRMIKEVVLMSDYELLVIVIMIITLVTCNDKRK